MLEQLTADDNYLQKILFCDEVTLQKQDVVSCHNCGMWGSENPKALMEHVSGSPKVNMALNRAIWLNKREESKELYAFKNQNSSLPFDLLASLLSFMSDGESLSSSTTSLS